MSKNRYRPGRTSSGFRPIGQGLQASRRELQDQSQIRIDALRLAKEQHREATNINISGLSDKHRFEQGVQKEKQVLENAVRERQYEALSIKADRDVDRLKGEAKQAEDYAEFVSKYGAFAPKSVAAYAKLGTAAYNYGQHLHGQKLIQESIDRGDFAKALEFQDEARLKLFKNVIKELQSDDLTKEQKNALFSKTFGSKNSGYGLWAYDQIKAKGDAERLAVLQIVQNTEGLALTKDNADEIYQFAAYERLRQLGINPTSKYGQKIIQQYQSWGRLAAVKKGFQAEATATDNALRTSINDKVFPLKGNASEKERLQLNLDFNAGVQRAIDGTWEVKGQFVTGKDAGLGNAYEHYGTLLVSSKPERFNSKDEVRDFFSRQCVAGQEGKKSCESWGQKHLGRTEKIVEAWEVAQRAKANDSELERLNNGTNLSISIRGQIDARNAASEAGDTEYEYDGKTYQVGNLKDHNLSLIQQIENADVDDRSKQRLLTSTGLLSSDASKHSDKYLWIQSLILDQNDNIEDGEALRIATTRFLSLTKTERDALRPEFQSLKNMSGYTYQSGKQVYSGVQAISHKVNKRVRDSQTEPGSGTSSGTILHETGERASILYTTMVVEKANELIAKLPDQYKGNPNAAIDDAFEIVDKIYAEGAPTIKEGKDKKQIKIPGTGPFARISGSYEGVKGWVFTGLPNSLDDNDVQLVIDRLEASDNGTLAHAKDEIANLKIGEYSGETVAHSMKFLGKEPEAMLKDPRLISPHNVTKLQRNLFKKTELHTDPFFSDQPLGDLEGMDQALKNIRDLAAASKEDVPTTINKLMEHYGHEERWPTDESTLSGLQNNGVIVKPANRRGMAFWQGAKNQYILPKTKDVDKALQGDSIQKIFKDNNGVDWVQGSKTDTSSGTYVISDPKKFFDNGGINVLIRDGIPAEVLQTLGFIDADVDVGDLPTSGELNDFLSPKEYRKLLDKKRSDKFKNQPITLNQA